MSQQKKETLVLALTLLITLGLLGIGAWWFFGRSSVKLNGGNAVTENARNLAVKDRISFGERSLISGDISPEIGGGQVVSEFDLSDPGFSAAKSVEQATISQGAKVLMLAANTGTLDKALQVVQVNRQRLELLGGDDVYSPKTLEVGQEAAEGMVVAVPWHIDAHRDSPFVSQSKQLWVGNVNWRTATAYDATKALIGAFAQRLLGSIERDPTRTGVQQALISPNFSASGASGTVQFLPSGDRNAPVQLVKIVSGQQSGTGYDFVPILK